MVEGHSVHRIATQHTRRLVGSAYRATSPNGRFAEGAQLINGRTFSRCEAIGKNLFAFFACSSGKTADVVMHVHFGMAGRWSVADPTAVHSSLSGGEPLRLPLTCRNLIEMALQ